VETPRIKVGVMSTSEIAPFYLAQQNGYFREQGIEPEAVMAPSGQASLAKLVGRETDISFGSYPPFFLAQAKGAADITFVADCTALAPKNEMLMAMPNSPVRTVNDLAGKRIAITGPGTATHLMVMAAMKNHGVDYSTVQWVTLPFPDMAGALARGDVDAALIVEPHVTQAMRAFGAAPVLDISEGTTEEFPIGGYATLGSFAKANPKTIVAFQRAMLRATREAQDRTKIEPLLVKYAKVDPETAALHALPAFQSTLIANRLQRVPDLMLEFGVIPQRIDAAPMIVQPQQR
jgi:NitT/TauT family transport system substrate-binding protein